MARQDTEQTRLAIGTITAAHGIKGWVKVFSYTDPIEQIFDYAPWQIAKGGVEKRLKLAATRRQGKSLVVLPEGYVDRNQAELLVGWEVRIEKTRLPALAPGEYYWHQLEGLRVVNTADVCLGVIDHMIETGANDVMVVKPAEDSIDDRERLVPFVEAEIVRQVDLSEGRVLVDWASDF